MALSHSKTWPVSTLAVVQLRVDPNGRTYSTQLDPDSTQHATEVTRDKTDLNQGSDKCSEEEDQPILPLFHHHVELFTKTHQPHPFKKTLRTDTVSTILDLDSEHTGNQLGGLEERFEKFHVLALARIDETTPEGDFRGRRPSIKVDNWDLIYTEKNILKTKRCPACTNRCNSDVTTLPSYVTKTKNPNDFDERLLPDLPLDARKVTTLRRHYYPEGGWGWVIIVCTVLVHVLNVGLQLSCSQLILPGADKFKTSPVHIAGMSSLSRAQSCPLLNGATPEETRPATPLSKQQQHIQARRFLCRHYYPEGGWGWIVTICALLVHVLNHGVQLSCSQLIAPAAFKFHVPPSHPAGNYVIFNALFST